jgi:hypothetical protein
LNQVLVVPHRKKIMDNLQSAQNSKSLPRVLLLGVIIVAAWGLLSGCQKEEETLGTADVERSVPALATAGERPTQPESETDAQPTDESTPTSSVELSQPDTVQSEAPPEEDVGASPPATSQAAVEPAPPGDGDEPLPTETTQSSTAETRIPPTSPAPSDVDPVPSTLLAMLAITTIQIGEDQIIVSGRSTLPAGTCIFTRLLTEDEEVAWWPAGTCNEVSAEAWQISVPFSNGGQSESLDEGAIYTLRAWAEGEPRLEAMPFVITLDDLDSLPPDDELPPETVVTPAPGSEFPPATGTLWVTTVQISADLVVVGGQSTFPEEICIHTRLLADQELVDWWPESKCVVVTDGRWQLAVPLGTSGRPATLDSAALYEVSAWAQAMPIFESVPFAFDLALPPG